MAKAFSLEDGNLNASTITQASARVYSDIDLTFTARPAGDLYKKKNVAAVKQAVKNLLLTGRSEKPFQPNFGGDLGVALFELDTDYQPHDIAQQISSTIARYEPRARVLNIDFTSYPDRNEIRATITFEVVNVGETVSLDVNLARLR
jgi:phage baseplate assembly protein W|tara:strand:- start:295 stop:735 length:441 start_codon:yes stop_codon:yes gene_type:complete